MNDPAVAVVYSCMDDHRPAATVELRPPERRLESTQPVVRSAPRIRRAISILTLLVLGAVGVVTWWTSVADAEDEGLLVRNADGSISLLDESSGDAAYELDDAVPTPDRSSLLTTRRDGGNTVLQSRDARTGAVTGSTELEGDLHVRSISPRGGAVVLMPGARSTDLYAPEPRTSTELTVAFLDDRPARRMHLEGNIEPEMLSLDETTLFVLQFSPPRAPTSYSVRKIDIETGAISDTDSIQVDLTRKMAGRARAQAMHPDGRFLYTLYTLPADQPIHDVEIGEDAERFAFVHVISLEDKWSHCVFLPIPFGTTDEATIGMTISPDGRRVLIGDPAIGQIAEMDADSLEVTAVHPVEQLRDTGERAVLAVADDGAVYASTGHVLLELDPETLQVVWASSVDAAVTGLSTTGSTLRIAKAGQVVLVDRASHDEIGVIGSRGRGTVDLLGPPGGSVVEFPLECAC